MKELAIIALLFALVLGVGGCSEKISCDAKTANMGMNHRYDMLAGCMIEPKPGIWIPLENYRALD